MIKATEPKFLAHYIKKKRWDCVCYSVNEPNKNYPEKQRNPVDLIVLQPLWHADPRGLQLPRHDKDYPYPPSSHGARTLPYQKEGKSRPSGMQRREAGLAGQRGSFVPVPPKNVDQTWRTLECPNYLCIVFKTLKSRTARSIMEEHHLNGLNSLEGMSHSPHPCRQGTQARKMERS